MSAPNLIGLAPRKNESKNSQRKVKRLDWLRRESVPGNLKFISLINKMISNKKLNFMKRIIYFELFR